MHQLRKSTWFIRGLHIVLLVACDKNEGAIIYAFMKLANPNELIVNDSPYGGEKTFNALRFAINLQ